MMTGAARCSYKNPVALHTFRFHNRYTKKDCNTHFLASHKK